MTRAERRVAERRTSELAEIGPLPQVANPRGTVVIAALTPRAIKCRGKVNPARFFPGFFQRLAERDHAGAIVFTPDALEACMGPRTTLVHLYNEENIIPTDAEVADAEAKSVCVFNPLGTGRIIGKKAATNLHLTAQGIAMPSLSPPEGAAIFSNAAASTSKPAWVVSDPDGLDETRYNTEFIDTTVTVDGKDYLTTLRLMAVGPTVVLPYVGIRRKDLKRPSVHGVSTPRDAALYNEVYQRLFLDREAELRALAVDLNRALGPGFYHHDLLIERGSGRILVCEVGYKFDPFAFSEHMAPVQDRIPSLQPLYDGRFARDAADAVLACTDAAEPRL